MIDPIENAVQRGYPQVLLSNLTEAEDACWAKYQKLAACPAAPGHGPFEARDYRNGSGYCTGCGGWFARVLPELPADPDARPSFLEKVFTGDEDSLAKVFEALDGLDQS